MQAQIAMTRHQDISTVERQGVPIPLSFAQRGLWLLEQLHKGSSAYNVSLAVRLGGALVVPALRIAIQRTVARHEVLRTTFPGRGGEPYQHVNELDVQLPVTDIAALPPAARERRAQALIDGWAHEPFDLTVGPLIRSRLIRLGEDDHILELVMHHMICDGWSIRLLFDELTEQYAGEAPRPLLRVQYADYASWEQRQLVGEGELDWWRDYLAGAPTTLALPTDHPRPTVRSTDGATQVFTLQRSLINDAMALARVTRSTPFMVMLTAYAALLGRLTGAQDLLIGTPVSNRSHPDLEELIGFFVNTVPVRVDLSGDPTFAQLLGRVRASMLAVLSHQQVPFKKLVEGLCVDRDPARTPLVQTVFTFDSRPLIEPRFAGLTTRLLTLRPATAKFDLDFMIVQAADDSGDFEVSVNYSTDLFDAATITRLAERFHRVLAAGVSVPNGPLRLLPALAEDERSAVLGKWSRTAPARATGTLIHELFAQQAAATPHAPAVSMGRQLVSYAELDARADRLAGLLQSMGVTPDEVVGCLLPRGVDLVTTVLGILKAGAAYLPLDPTHPAGHLTRVLDIANIRVVVTASVTAHRLIDTRVDPLLLDELELYDGPSVAAQPRARPDNLAYVIFTSGSTGEPKGVGIPHRALVNHAQTMRERFALSQHDRVLQFANIGFDVAAEELFPTWLAGGCVVLCSEPPPPPHALVPVLTEGQVTVANLPASYWQHWVSTLDLGGEFPAPALRLLVVGSENVDTGTVTTWCRSTGVALFNAYGLTETTITAVVHQLGGEVAGTTVPIGRPIDGVEAYVLDAELEPVAPGVRGELYLGGAGLARGYLGRPDLTADRFVPHPFATMPGARIHRTGDYARWRADGTLEVLGRIDEQLKVRGYRIEPGQVEAALCSHPEVVQAVVVARGGAEGNSRLIGYVVPRVGGDVPADLRDHLASRLPGYFVPSVLVALDQLPRSASGKVNRAALPEPPAPAPAATVPACTDLERRLVLIWREVLGLEKVGIHDNFFDLGGNSFTLVGVHARLDESLGLRLPLVTFYEYPTIAGLAHHLAEGGKPAAPAAETQADRLRAGRGRLRQRRLLHR